MTKYNTSTISLGLRDVKYLVHVRLWHHLPDQVGNPGQQDRVDRHQGETGGLNAHDTGSPHLQSGAYSQVSRKEHLGVLRKLFDPVNK